MIFFEKGKKTKDIWYYEHKLPEGQKSYSKTKPIQFNEFQPIIDWWNDRKESDVAWKVNVNDLKDWDLDIKNPIKEEGEVVLSVSETIEKLEKSLSICNQLFSDIKSDL